MLNDLGDLNRQFDQAVSEVADAAGLDMMRSLAEEALNWVVEETPVWSGYAASNHRIGVGGLEDAEVSPPIRVAFRGAYVDEIEPTRAAEIAKLAQLSSGQVVEVGNAVPYFLEIGWSEQQGADIYETGAVNAVLRAQHRHDGGG